MKKNVFKLRILYPIFNCVITKNYIRKDFFQMVFVLSLTQLSLFSLQQQCRYFTKPTELTILYFSYLYSDLSLLQVTFKYTAPCNKNNTT